MIPVPDELRERLKQAGQEHVLAFWPRLDDAERRTLLSQVQGLDLAQLRALYASRDKAAATLDAARIEPVPVIGADAPDNAERREQGEAALRRGEVAALLVAGGQGTRLGFDHPKGLYAVGPVSRKTLFHLHAEKVLAASRRYGKAVPFLVMTSHATHDETVAFFEKQRFFGLPREEVFFFQQGTMPALDLATGRLLLEAPGRLFLSPDGHGGTLTALSTSGLLARLKARGVRHVSYFQVDNPLVRIADPVFLGHHLHHGAEVSSKIVAKRGPAEKVGVFAQVGGRCTIIEYSDLPKQLAEATDERGRLQLWAGSPAIHLFDVAFLERMAREEGMPFHVAHKKVPHIDAGGKPVQPQKENALKFERFIFDALPRAERWLVVETTREAEFAPLKNATGDDSPATTEKAISDLAAAWLRKAGCEVAAGPVEVSPLFALDEDELAGKVPKGTRVEGPRYFE
jgi:UDP-N-acetylglucosamine/UDP-N-acetylgalactosamine diphosphorylase